MARLLDDGSWEIRGRRLGFPVRIGAASAACATYLVRTARVRALLAGTGLAPVSVAGRTPLFLVLVDYHRDDPGVVNDLGDYAEVGVALLVRHRGRTGPCIRQLPVTGEFTMEAGRALWGLPKWLARAALTVSPGAASGRLADADGRPVLTAEMRARVPLPGSLPGTVTALAPHDDGVFATSVRARVGGIRAGVGGTTVTLGTGHPMAGELRELGLPRRALLTVVAGRVSFELDAALDVPR